jgi:hypothetical protein
MGEEKGTGYFSGRVRGEEKGTGYFSGRVRVRENRGILFFAIGVRSVGEES